MRALIYKDNSTIGIAVQALSKFLTENNMRIDLDEEGFRFSVGDGSALLVDAESFNTPCYRLPPEVDYKLLKEFCDD